MRVPATREVVRDFTELPPAEVDELLDSPIHEHRLAALLILNAQQKRAVQAKDQRAQKVNVDRYLAALKRGRINNWDLVDASAEHVIGVWLLDKPRTLLFELAEQDSLWDRRVALLSTFAFIKKGDPSTTFELATQLIDDRRDLVQKAVGWMLREVGKRVDQEQLAKFLDANAAEMGRTALSYATEHLDPAERAVYRAKR
ncbi:hypothetical protein GCM10011591_21720 [Nocardia camponoti]|uniref:DNA alkylation repair protein n=1 Tax=Nocardia camponoti TaxID=1616106 RepID=A0A917V8C6_9NOCA|nr:hypothetical protein GCM10011591_21720 [Nocardia camponoti]